MSASHSRAANSNSVLRTACRSKVERLMTLSTSAVAVCCCSNSAQRAQQPRVLDGDDSLGREARQQSDLLFGKGPAFGTVDDNGADQLVVPEHRDAHRGSCASDLDQG